MFFHGSQTSEAFFFFFLSYLRDRKTTIGFVNQLLHLYIQLTKIKNKNNFLIQVLSCGRQLPKLKNREVQERLVLILKSHESSMISQGSIGRGIRNRNQLVQTNNQDTPRNHSLSKGISLSLFFTFLYLQALLPWLV